MVKENINEVNDKEIFLSIRGLDESIICDLGLLYVDVIPSAVTIVMYFGLQCYHLQNTG